MSGSPYNSSQQEISIKTNAIVTIVASYKQEVHIIVHVKAKPCSPV